jgi:hypothetical protein
MVAKAVNDAVPWHGGGRRWRILIEDSISGRISRQAIAGPHNAETSHLL